jgi:hypothetical protein
LPVPEPLPEGGLLPAAFPEPPVGERSLPLLLLLAPPASFLAIS